MSSPKVDLSQYRNPEDLDKGRSILIRALWHVVNAVVLQSPLNPSSKLKIMVLRMFGAKIGRGCVLKPSMNIKSPWYLTVGDYCFLGERVWIDSLAPVTLGNNVCISQDVYLCCGNHDWTDPHFGKTVKPIIVEDGVWIATRATVLSGVTLRSHSVIAAGAIMSKDSEPYRIYAGNPAEPVKIREIISKPN